MILAIDPGTTESGWCLFDEARNAVYKSEVQDNKTLLSFVSSRGGTIPFAIEMIDSYGMRVGREVFETCVWIGRFQQAWRDPEAVKLIYRREVVQYLLPPPKKQYRFETTDANIRQALIDRLGPIGTKKEPGPLYGVKSHAWAALAVAVTAFDNAQKIV